MKRSALFAFAFAGLAACETPISAPTPREPSVSMPSFATIFNESFPVSGLAFNSCPPQEFVEFEGRLHVLVTSEETPTEVSFKTHVNAQEIEGVGLTSGDIYRVEDNAKDEVTFTFLPTFSSEQEQDFRFRLIREGPEDNLWFRFTFRSSFDPARIPPFEFEIIRNDLECRG
jgi:hypothetical protein